MKMPGHETRSIFDRYNIVDEQDLDEAAEEAAEEVDGVSREATTGCFENGYKNGYNRQSLTYKFLECFQKNGRGEET